MKGKITVYVKSLTGKTITVEVDKSDKVEVLYSKLYRVPEEKSKFDDYKGCSIGLSRHFLLFGSRTLDTSKTFESNNVGDDYTIHVSLRYSTKCFLRIICKISDGTKLNLKINGRYSQVKDLKQIVKEATGVECASVSIKKKKELRTGEDTFRKLDDEDEIPPTTIYITLNGKISSDKLRLEFKNPVNNHYCDRENYWTKLTATNVRRSKKSFGEGEFNPLDCVEKPVIIEKIVYQDRIVEKRIYPSLMDMIHYATFYGAVGAASSKIIWAFITKTTRITPLSEVAKFVLIGALSGAIISYGIACVKPRHSQEHSQSRSQ